MTGFAAQKSCIAKGAYLMKIDNNDEYLWAQSSLWVTFYNKTLITNYWVNGNSTLKMFQIKCFNHIGWCILILSFPILLD